MQIRRTHQLTSVIAAVLILLFCYTGISKLIGHDKFRTVIGKSPLIGETSAYVSWMLPVTELAVCIFLFFPVLRRTGFLLAGILMALFTGYIIYMLEFASRLRCSCGGVLQQLSWPAHLLFNIFFTILAWIGWVMQKKMDNAFYTNPVLSKNTGRISRTPI